MMLRVRKTISSGIFGEVVKTYSNVEGGAGIFAAVSGVRIEVPVNQIKVTPTFMGEADVIKMFQALPGVVSYTFNF